MALILARDRADYGSTVPNRLADATSPYLRQHADNPVDWQEWGPLAFEEAQVRQVPVLLSVGYAACHWCHVMAHESFEDPETAETMNRLFVNVKVDREERPDVDAIYMDAVQATTGRGGWPMTVWLTPEGNPFYTGTYFPDTPRNGMPSFRQVIEAVADAFSNRRSEVESQAANVAAMVGRRLPATTDLPGRPALEAAYAALAATFDAEHGGFGGAPKFPQQPLLEFMLRISDQPFAPTAETILVHTLTKMADGGIHDQIGGGFARYSVDAQWLVPHFEKMLYDNAQLARLYLWAWRETGVERFRRIGEGVLKYLLRDLHHPGGGFYSSEDADSEGEEGKYYVWDYDEFITTVGEETGAMVGFALGVTGPGNFEGSSILHRPRHFRAVADRYGLTEAELEAMVAAASERLLARRSARIKPGLDDKIIAGWNGLAIRTFAEAGAATGDPRYVEVARQTAEFLVADVRIGTGALARSWQDGRARVKGFLDDYAGMAVGLLALYQASGEIRWFSEAASLVRAILEEFSDPEGGFFTTADDAEALIARPKELFDNPSPSGNSLAVEALIIMARLTGDASFWSAAEGAIRSAGALVERYPSGVGHLLALLASLDRGFQELAVSGPQPEPFTAVAWRRFRPHLLVALDRDGSGGGTIPLLADRYQTGQTQAYLCTNMVCDLPTNLPEVLAGQLD